MAGIFISCFPIFPPNMSGISDKLQSSWRVFYCFHTFGRIDWIGSRLVRAKDGRGWPTRVPQKILVRK